MPGTLLDMDKAMRDAFSEIAELPRQRPLTKSAKAWAAWMNRPALLRYHANKRRKIVIERTPSWADQKAIRDVYIRAAEMSARTGVPHHVDHEIPLRGKRVSGLHVHQNLKVITAEANLKKYNQHADWA